MYFRKIEFQNYKSIQESVVLSLDRDLPTILIGKNGSGKTNLLEAIEKIISANTEETRQQGNPFPYCISMELEEEEFATFFPKSKWNQKKANFEVSNAGGNMKIAWIKSKYLVPRLRNELEDIRKLAEQLKAYFDEYKEQLVKIGFEENGNEKLECFTAQDFHGKTTNYGNLKFNIEFELQQTEQDIHSLLEKFDSDDTTALSFHYTPFENLKPFELDFQLKYAAPQLAKFEEKFITIDEEAIQVQIQEFNLKTKELSKKINECYEKIRKSMEHYHNAFVCSGAHNVDEGYPFLAEIRRAMGKKCL